MRDMASKLLDLLSELESTLEDSAREARYARDYVMEARDYVMQLEREKEQLRSQLRDA